MITIDVFVMKSMMIFNGCGLISFDVVEKFLFRGFVMCNVAMVRIFHRVHPSNIVMGP